MNIKLRQVELLYLAQAQFLSDAMQVFFGKHLLASGEDRVIALAAADVEDLGSALTQRLAAAGFDADYEPNAEGALLEDLIDKLRR